MRLELYDSNKLNFVEFNVSGDNENYVKLDSDSKFMDMEVFNLFAHCFESSNKLYEYYDATKYNSRTIVPLRNELLGNLERIEAIQSQLDFIEFLGNIFLGSEFVMKLHKMDKSWETNWQSYKQKLADVNREIIRFIDYVIEEEKVLWVIGY